MVPPKKNLATELQRSTPQAPKAQDVDPTLSNKKLKSSKTDFQLAEGRYPEAEQMLTEAWSIAQRHPVESFYLQERLALQG